LTRFQTTLLLIVLTFGAVLASHQGLKDRPLTFFLLGGNPPEAFRVRASLASGETSLEPIPLDRRKAQTAREVMERRDTAGVRALADEVGRFQGVLAVQGDDWEGSLSHYLGGGFRQMIQGRPKDAFDDLGALDRAFLTLLLRAPGTPPLSGSTIEVDIPAKVPISSSPVPTPEAIGIPPAGPLRVEIQNGCGIKGAADWAARRLKGPGLKVVGTGNAPNFQYPKTLVKSAVGKPVALEEALERLGVLPDALEELPTLSGLLLDRSQGAPAVDIVVVIGRDFRELRSKVSRKR